MGRAEAELRPLRGFLKERGWAQRVETYDQYGGPRMSVTLTPSPSQEQLDVLYAQFGNAYEFGEVYQQFHGNQPGVP